MESSTFPASAAFTKNRESLGHFCRSWLKKALLVNAVSTHGVDTLLCLKARPVFDEGGLYTQETTHVSVHHIVFTHSPTTHYKHGLHRKPNIQSPHTFHMYPLSFTKLLIPFFISTSTCLKTCSFSSSRFQSAFPTVLRLRNAKFWTSVFSVWGALLFNNFPLVRCPTKPYQRKKTCQPYKKVVYQVIYRAQKQCFISIWSI